MSHGSRTTKPPSATSTAKPAASTRARTASTLGQLDGPAVEAGGVRGRGPDAAALPDVDGEVVVVAAGGHERGGAQVRLELEAEDVAVEAPARGRCRPRAGADGRCAGPRRRGRWAPRRGPSRAASRSPAAPGRRRSRGWPATARAGGRRPARCRCRPDRRGRSPRACGGRTRPGCRCRSRPGGRRRARAPRGSGTGARSGRGRRGGPRAGPGGPRGAPGRSRLPSPSSARPPSSAWTRSPSACSYHATERATLATVTSTAPRRSAAGSTAAARGSEVAVEVIPPGSSVNPGPGMDGPRGCMDVLRQRPRSRSRYAMGGSPLWRLKAREK